MFIQRRAPAASPWRPSELTEMAYGGEHRKGPNNSLL
jgi:hypothetical protein